CARVCDGAQCTGRVLRLGGPQNPEVGPARHLYGVGAAACRGGIAAPGFLPGGRPGRLADGVGERFEVVAGRPGGRGVDGQPDHLPAAGGGEAFGVLRAQVVAVRLRVSREGTEDRGRVGVDIRQRRDGGAAASGARTATYGAHDVGPYRTPERAATTHGL